ncbi:MAG TPA: glycerol-3-phosphate dehydrogenase, partial [Chloroflexi bacterium]|nr:glycerol-3-phosphate dehydrogenase [Chloroflexota bacterium]
MGQVAVIGSGSWGTTLSIIVAQAQGSCLLWMHNYDEARETAARRENVRFLPGVTLPATVQIEHELEVALAEAEVVIVAVPMRRLEENWREIAAGIDSTAIVVSGIKGLMPRSGERVSEVLTRISGPDVLNRFSVLSGPNLAREIVAGEPATSVVASTSSVLATQVQGRLRAPTFRTYVSGDVVGVELAGALKNVIAIGAGMADGLRFGDNAKAALMTRGLAEITRLGVAAGA